MGPADINNKVDFWVVVQFENKILISPTAGQITTHSGTARGQRAANQIPANRGVGSPVAHQSSGLQIVKAITVPANGYKTAAINPTATPLN